MYRSTEEKKFMRPGHHWHCKFGDAGDGTSCEKKSNLTRRTWENYKGTQFYNGQQALVVEQWLNRVKKMPRVSLLRSGTRHKTQMPRSHQLLCSSTRRNCVR